jgi:hypothetical protein
MEYKSEIYNVSEPPSLFDEGEGEHVLINVGVAIALTAIALSVAMIIFGNFAGNPRAQGEGTLGKFVPVADADALLIKLARLSTAGEIQK